MEDVKLKNLKVKEIYLHMFVMEMIQNGNSICVEVMKIIMILMEYESLKIIMELFKIFKIISKKLNQLI